MLADLPHTLLSRLRSLWRGLRSRGDLDAEMAEEFRHHLALRTEDLMRSGLSPDEAHRRARIEFGHIDNHREDARASRGLRLFDEFGLSWLDVKLGLRMLGKYPGLTVVSVLGMSIAIAIGAGGFGWIHSLMDPSLPLPEDERIVSVQNATNNPGNPERRAVHDFLMWRDELKSVRDLSAFTSELRNLVTPAGNVELVWIKHMSASGFRVAQVAPLKGRTLLDDDERLGAPLVAVISYDAWQNSFNGDPDIVGRDIRLGTELHTVVGVMPSGFRFPINDQFWTPLKLDATAYARGAGPAITMFGRLADGVSLEQARAEIATIGKRMAAAYPDTHAQLRPQIMRYAHPYFDIDSPGMALAYHAGQVAISLILVLVAVNVGVLVYARTATRTSEIAVRSALGASRRRVVTQLFAEALVLSGIAAVIGLTIAGYGLVKTEAILNESIRDELPFWLDFGLSPGVVAYTAGLAILGAVIIGVLPALRATGRNVQGGLQRLSARGSQMQLGRTWSALIITQVAVAVAILPFAFYIAGQSVLRATVDPAYPVDEFVRATVSLEWKEPPPGADTVAFRRAQELGFRTRANELLRRIDAEPRVASVTYGEGFAGGGSYRSIEVENVGRTENTAADSTMNAASIGVVSNAVDTEFFNTFDVALLAGRRFNAADTRPDANVVMVDRVLADQIAKSGPVLGRRVRYINRRDPADIETGPWLEVIGVVPDFTVQYDYDPADPRLYQPMSIDDAADNFTLAIRLTGRPTAAFTQELRELAAAVDPALQLHYVRSAAELHRQAQASLRYLGIALVAGTVAVLLLSAAGIYAMMSFTITKRRREIGIRSALGADPRRLLASIFARAGAQLAIGVGCGLVVATALAFAMGGGPLAGNGVLLLPVIAALITAIGLLAAVGPARRGLAIQPTEALKEE